MDDAPSVIKMTTCQSTLPRTFQHQTFQTNSNFEGGCVPLRSVKHSVERMQRSRTGKGTRLYRERDGQSSAKAARLCRDGTRQSTAKVLKGQHPKVIYTRDACSPANSIVGVEHSKDVLQASLGVCSTRAVVDAWWKSVPSHVRP